MTTLRSKLIKLAHTHPETRSHLLPLLVKTAASKAVTLQGIINGYPYTEHRELNMIGPETDAKKYAVTMITALSVPFKDENTGELVKPEPTYNDYDARKVGRWAMKIEQMFPGTLFLPGRELSVVLYVKADASVMPAIYKAAGRLGPSERDIYTGPSYSAQHVAPANLAGMSGQVYLRLWWD